MGPIAISQPIPKTGGEAAVADEDFTAMVNLYRSRISRFALAALRDRDAAETIAQDCFLKAFKTRGSFREDCSLNTWLMQIAVNLVRDYLRNRRLQFWKRLGETASPVEEIGGSLADGHGSPERRALEKEKVEAVWAAAAFLPERQRTVFLLRFVEDMELLEIAAATGMKEGTGKTHLFRALHAVRQRLGAEA